MSLPPDPTPVPPVGVEIESVRQKLQEMKDAIESKIPVTCYTGADMENLQAAFALAVAVKNQIDERLAASQSQA